MENKTLSSYLPPVRLSTEALLVIVACLLVCTTIFFSVGQKIQTSQREYRQAQAWKGTPTGQGTAVVIRHNGAVHASRIADQTQTYALSTGMVRTSSATASDDTLSTGSLPPKAAQPPIQSLGLRGSK